MSDHYFTNRPNAPHELSTFVFTLRGHPFQLTTDAGVFSRDRVDFGSVLLIETMQFSRDAHVLDVGCGYGPIGLAAAKMADLGSVVMIDINERAVELAKINARQNGIQNVEILVSDLYEQVRGRQFDAILTNPPIRAGKEIVHRIFSEGFELLKPGGKLWVVIQKKQGAPSAWKKLQEIYGKVEMVERSKGYSVFCAER